MEVIGAVVFFGGFFLMLSAEMTLKIQYQKWLLKLSRNPTSVASFTRKMLFSIVADRKHVCVRVCTDWQVDGAL